MRGRWLGILLCTHGCMASSSDTAPTDEWVGRWTGPEGTYLDIAGTKWLAGKANCLTIMLGEGYCRD